LQIETPVRRDHQPVPTMKTLRLRGDEIIPALGMGTWKIGETRTRRAEEIATLRAGLGLGLKLIDTAEMYGDGASEELIGEAIAGRRAEAFLVSKVYPHNASRAGAVAACERSLARLKTDYLDLYLLHWRGRFPLVETIEAFERLRGAGKIRHWGVSNFDLADMAELISVTGGQGVATNQVLYNLTRRGIEWDLLPWAQARGLPMMAYSPIEQAELLAKRELAELAFAHAWTPAQLAIAWVLDRDGVIAIPKTSNRVHLQENAGALDVTLSPEIRRALDTIFPAPRGPSTLEML
jgi:diketogulonate reductase-like aldo/keto reductase